uniref:Ubiquitin-protein ligase E3B n=1 Tax=Hirondellea gigas TaxID=1518452 RepID=A0A2P2I5M6_9CRUS
MFGGCSTGGDQVVSAAREAREERAAARRREAAAVLLQAAVRGFVARRKHFRNIREQFDSVLSSFSSSTADVVLPDPITAFTVAARMLRSYNPQHDQHRLHCYARYLVSSLHSPGLQQRCMACSLSQQHTLSWIQHIKQVLVLSCQTLQQLSCEVSSEGRLLSLHLQLLLELTSTVTWPALPAPLLPPLTRLTDNFLQHLVQRDLYPTLKRILLKGLCRSKPLLSGPALGTVLTLALRPLPSTVSTATFTDEDTAVKAAAAAATTKVTKSRSLFPSVSQSATKGTTNASSQKASPGCGRRGEETGRVATGVSAFPQERQLLSQFLLHFLCVPGVLQHLTDMLPQSTVLLQKKNIFEQCVEFLYGEQRLRIMFHTLEASYALCLLANTIHLAHHYVSAYNSSTTSHPCNNTSNTEALSKAEADAKTAQEEAQSKQAFDETMFRFNSVVRRLLEKCGEYVSSKQGGSSSAVCSKSSGTTTSSQWHPVLGWFAQQLDQHLQESLTYVTTQLYLLWSQPLLNTLFSVLPTLLPHHELTNKAETSGVGAQTVASAAHFSDSGSRPWSIRRIFDRKLSITGGGNSMGRTGDSVVSNKLSSVAVQQVAAACSLYYLAMQTLNQLKMDILTGLCYKSGVVVQLWWLLQSFGSNCGLKNFLERLAQASKPTSLECHMIILFCDATAHLVTVLDDLELYEQQKPFTTNDYSMVAIFLNTMCYRLLDQGLVDSRHVWACPLFSAAHSLLSLLFRRNSRRPFVPSEKVWLIPELKLSTFKDNLMNGNIVEQVMLQTLPHIIPHEERVLLFRANVAAQKASLEQRSSTPQFTMITVFRTRMVEDGYRHLNSLPPNALKNTIRVKFVNEQGLEEAGIDQDGVFKEFLEETLKRVLDPSLNLFKMSSENQLYPSPSSVLTENHLELLEFTGKMLGKALYDGIVVDCPFSGFFLSQVIGEQQSALYSSIDQLSSLDPELYKNLTYIKHYDGNVEDLGLTFSYDEERLGEVVSHDLRPGGKLLPVTNDNRIIYIHLMAHFKMHTQIRDQTKAFVKGFRSIVNPEWLAMFSIPELQRIISGDNVEINLKDLRRHTHYYGGFHDSHRVISWLWDILDKDFTSDEHSKLLKFVTSCSKPPLLGFEHLEPPFSIRCVEVGDDEDTGDTVGSVVRGFLAVGRKDPIHRLPTASTCFNLLKLPNYQKKSTLKNKLRYAISSNTGFELS